MIRRLLRDPVAQFVLFGLALFALDRAVRTVRPARDPEAIVVSAAFVEGLREEERRALGRAPTAEGLEARVRDHVRQEALVRAATELGLDRGDPIVRRRLAQKMEFLLRGTLEVPPPTEAEIRAYVAAHSADFVRPEERSFRHAFFARARRGEQARADAEAALADASASADPAARLAALGDPFPLGPSQPSSSESRLAERFGAPFAHAVFACTVHRPCGPVESAFGFHVIWVSESRAGGPMPDSTTRPVAVRELSAEAERRALERRIDEEVARYRVVREGSR